MPVSPLQISTNHPVAHHSGSSSVSSSPPLSPAESDTHDALNSILDRQTAADPQRFIQQLPDHIVTLQRLAEQNTYSTPAPIEALAHASGLTRPLMPCTTGGTMVTRLNTVDAINEQLQQLQNEMNAIQGFQHRAAQEGHDMSMVRVVAGAYKYGMVLAALSNIYAAGKLLMEHSSGQQTHTLLGVAREVVALAIHAKLFGDMRADSAILEQIRNTRSVAMREMPGWDAANPHNSLQAMMARVKQMGDLNARSDALLDARDKAQRTMILRDLPAMLAGLMTLAVAGYAISMVNHP